MWGLLRKVRDFLRPQGPPEEPPWWAKTTNYLFVKPDQGYKMQYDGIFIPVIQYPRSVKVLDGEIGVLFGTDGQAQRCILSEYKDWYIPWEIFD